MDIRHLFELLSPIVFGWLKRTPVGVLERVLAIESERTAQSDRLEAAMSALKRCGDAFRLVQDLIARVEAVERRQSALHDDMVLQIADAKSAAHRAQASAAGAIGGRAPRGARAQAADVGERFMAAMSDPQAREQLITELQNSPNGEDGGVLGLGGNRNPRE